MIAQTTTISADTFDARTFTSPQGIVLPYRLLRPSRVASGTTVPMVRLFHGAGEIGADNEKQMTVFAKLWARDDIRHEFPAFVVVPQFPARSTIYSGPVTQGGRTSAPAAPLHAALALVDELRETLPVDASRVYLTGFSMGASSTWNALHLRPDLFAAAVPIGGIANRAFAPHVAVTPVWVLHGNRNVANALNHERVMFEALSHCVGAAIVFWEHDGLGHEVPPSILAGSQLPRWLFSHRKAAGPSAPRPCL